MIRKSSAPFQWEIIKLNNEASVKYLKTVATVTNKGASYNVFVEYLKNNIYLVYFGKRANSTKTAAPNLDRTFYRYDVLSRPIRIHPKDSHNHIYDTFEKLSTKYNYPIEPEEFEKILIPAMGLITSADGREIKPMTSLEIEILTKLQKKYNK